MNSITIAGTIGRDAELRHLNDGTAIASFSIADNQGKDKPPVWWSASIFGKRAEALQQYLVKGQAVTVTGSVSERAWTDKDGAQRKSMDVRVQDLALQGGKRESASSSAHVAGAQKPNQPKSSGSGFDDMGDEPPF